MGVKIKENISYIITVLITIIIMHIIYSGAGDSTFTEQFSFASTITSIILSVIAIIYTFIDGESGKVANEKIINSAEVINSNTNKLGEMITAIDNSVEGLNRIDELKEILLKIERNNHDNFRKVDEVMREMLITKVESNNIKLSLTKEDFKNILNSLDMSTKRNYLLIYLSYKNNFKLDVNGFNKFYNTILIEEDLPTGDVTESIFTTLNMLRAFNLLKYSYVEYEIIVDEFNNTFAEAINELLPKDIIYVDSPCARFYGSVYKFLKL